MPPKELYCSRVIMRPVNTDGTYGEPIKLDSLEPIDIDSEPFETYPSDTICFDLPANEPIICLERLTLPHKKISRKTFKKWLMHFPWINRNEAEAYCCLIAVAKGRISYSATYHDMAFIMSFERPGIALFNSFARQLKETEKQT